jgi:hypothetical protein
MLVPLRGVLLSSTLFLTLLQPAVVFAQSQSAAPDSATREEIESFLRTAKVTGSKVLKSGVTLPRKLTLTDGKVVRSGIFKTIDEHKGGMTRTSTRDEVDFKDSWKYEVAAYELDKLLSLNLVPVTVEREYENVRGSLQIWIDNAMPEADRVKKNLSPPDPESWNQAMFKVRVFDNLIFNFDRNLGNLLVGPDWKLYMIDHSRSFKVFSDLRSPGGLTRMSVSLMERLKNLDKATVKARCASYLTGPEIDALFERRDKILQLYARLVAEKGSSATYP